MEEYVGWNYEEGNKSAVEEETKAGVGKGDWEKGQGLRDEEDFRD